MVVYAQEPVDVSEQTIKVGGFAEEQLFYGFSEGDKIIFNYKELGGKELKEIEIAEYPSNSKFSDYKSKQIENKSITVGKTGVYVFRFKNTAMAARVCKIKIQRIPKNDAARNFNSAVTWVTKQDTTWHSYTKDVVIGYDTLYTQKVRKELVKVDTVAKPLFDKILRVHSETAAGKTQHTYATVELPRNSYAPNQVNPYQTTEVVAWSYWLGVGQKSTEEYEKANRLLRSGLQAVGSLTGYGALASLAVTGISLFTPPSMGDNVHFKFSGLRDRQEVVIDQGNVVSASGRNEKVRQGAFSVHLFNDNFREGIDVSLKMVVVQVSKTWQDIPYREQTISPRTVKKIFKDPIISAKKIPLLSE
ncbi:hypothetical protein [Rufibacter sp. LB8]|uniref:hypothetical protein n=1 Tax=Rufibacter sp. LB8 TaxID=2777781 RepID=UPI00178C7558|nr:hypothetical protein [Rufibacter sp. LB8]